MVDGVSYLSSVIDEIRDREWVDDAPARRRAATVGNHRRRLAKHHQ